MNKFIDWIDDQYEKNPIRTIALGVLAVVVFMSVAIELVGRL